MPQPLRNPGRKIAFVLASSDHGTMILNRLDYKATGPNTAVGVGIQLLETSSYNPGDLSLILPLIDLRRKYFGDGVVAIDCGANIGVHTIEWAKRMHGWGSVLAIEAQERLFYALAGNIAINNCFNAKALFAAVAAETGTMKVPRADYLTPGSFGSLELRKRDDNEHIGQAISYDDGAEIRTQSIDDLALDRIDLIKLDIEGMELDALRGAIKSIKRSRPVIVVETIKSNKHELRAFLERFDYDVVPVGVNFLAVHKADRTLAHVKR